MVGRDQNVTSPSSALEPYKQFWKMTLCLSDRLIYKMKHSEINKCNYYHYCMQIKVISVSQNEAPEKRGKTWGKKVM